MIYQHFSLVLCLMLFSAAFGALDYDLENNVKELVTRRRYLKFMKQLVDDMDNQISRLQIWACLSNVPGVKCGYGDVASDSERFGQQIPDKDRRTNSCDIRIGNPEGCMGKMGDGDKKDTKNWGRPDGPGKK